jgi:hypothetical protein
LRSQKQKIKENARISLMNKRPTLPNLSRSSLFLLTALALSPRPEVQAADELWTGAANGSWHIITNWSPNTGFAGQGATALANQGTINDIAAFTGTNTTSNVGINMGTLGGLLSLGAIDMVRTTAGNLQLGNNSPTNGILQLNGATVNSVAKTLIRVSGTVGADLTIANVNNASGGSQTMGLRLGITDGIFTVDTGRTLILSTVVSQAMPTLDSLRRELERYRSLATIPSMEPWSWTMASCGSAMPMLWG